VTSRKPRRDVTAVGTVLALVGVGLLTPFAPWSVGFDIGLALLVFGLLLVGLGFARPATPAAPVDPPALTGPTPGVNIFASRMINNGEVVGDHVGIVSNDLNNAGYIGPRRAPMVEPPADREAPGT
jgi:hypothetical protein